MENVVDALYMAVAILILIIALSVSISSFTKVKSEVQQIMKNDEMADLATYGVDVDGNGTVDRRDYINYIKSIRDNESNRTVGVETIIPTIRKIQNESYVVYIHCNNMDTVVPDWDDIWESVDVNGITYMKIATEGENFKKFTRENIRNLYEGFQGITFNEYIGVYREYKENVSDADNEEHRIIIYEQI